MMLTLVTLQTVRELVCSPAAANLFLVFTIGVMAIYLSAVVFPRVGDGDE